MTQVHVAPPGGWLPEPINPDRWADNMLKAWKTAAYHKGIGVQKRLISLTEIDSAEPGELVNTPRSLQACLLLGIDPEEIQYRDISYFMERGLSKKLQELKFLYYEKERKDKLVRLLEERNRIIKEHDTASVFIQDGQVMQRTRDGGGKPMSEAQSKANKNADVALRRAEKEIAQKKELEEVKKTMEKETVRVLELRNKKNADQKRTKALKDKEFAAQMFAQEQRKLQEEEELEKEARKLAEKRYKEEMKLAEERAIATKKAKKAAIQKEKERVQKQADFQLELELIQENVLREAEKKKKEFEARDKERLRLQAIKKKEIAELNALNRAEAEKRQEQAMKVWLGFLQKQKDDYARKCAKQAQAVRAKEKLVLWKRQQAEKKAKEEKGEKHRQQTIQNAANRLEKRCQMNIQKANHKAKLLKEYMKRRDLERRCYNTEKNLQALAQYWRCQAVARKQALHRKQVLDQIERETKKIKALFEAREAIAKARQLRLAKLGWGHEV